MSKQSHRLSRTSHHTERCGGIVVLVAILMTVLVTLSVFAINLVYMEITPHRIADRVRCGCESCDRASG